MLVGMIISKKKHSLQEVCVATWNRTMWLMKKMRDLFLCFLNWFCSGSPFKLWFEALNVIFCQKPAKVTLLTLGLSLFVAGGNVSSENAEGSSFYGTSVEMLAHPHCPENLDGVWKWLGSFVFEDPPNVRLPSPIAREKLRQGICLLMAFLWFDSFTSNFQEKLFKEAPRAQSRIPLSIGDVWRKCCDGSMKRTTLMDYITPSTTIAPNVACFQVIYQFPSLQASFSRSQVVCWNPRTTCPNTTRCSTWIWVLPWLRRLSALQACFSADWLSCERKTAQYVTAYAGVDIGSLQQTFFFGFFTNSKRKDCLRVYQ